MLLLVGKIALVVTAVVGLGTSAAWTQPSGTREPQLIRVAPMVFIETKATGEEVVHHCLHAHLQVPLDARDADLPPVAKDLFDRRLRAEAEAGDKSSVWVTFYFANTPADFRGTVRTFRVIYVREGAGWQSAPRDAPQAH